MRLTVPDLSISMRGAPMTERVETVRLTAQVSNFISGMEKAQLATAKTATEAQKLAAKKEAINTLGLGMVAFGGLVAAGVALAVSKMADFDQKMSQVQTLSHATGAEMEELSDAALHLGQSIGFSASQVADAETELVKAGVAIKDQLGGGLVGTLNLAAAGQLDVADATQIAASAMTQFALKGKDVPHVADLLAAGADKALGSVQDLGNGLKFVGPVAHSMGVSLDETVGTLALFAQNGILGEQAGTGLRGVLLSLTSPSALASKVLKEYNINLYDAQGHFIGLAGTAQQLKKGLGGLDEATRNQALGQIFGNQQITQATLLMQGGAKEVKKWTEAVNDQGFAAEQAAGKMDNLKGDLSKLQAAIDTGLIESAGGANTLLRGLTQNATGLATVVGNLPAPVIQAGLLVTGLVGGITLLGGTALLAVPKIAEFKAAMSSLNLTTGALVGKIGKGGALLLGLAAIGSGLAGLGAQSDLSADKLAQVDEVAGKLTKKNLNKLFEATGVGDSGPTVAKQADDLRVALNQLASGNFFENSSQGYKFIDGLTFGLTHLSDVYKTNEAQFRELGKQIATVAQTNLPAAQDGFEKMVAAAGGGKEAIRQLLTVMPDYKAQLVAIAGDQGKTLTASELYNVAIGKGKLAHEIAAEAAKKDAAQIKVMGGAAAAAADDVSGLSDQINGFGSLALDARAASRAFQAAVDDMSQSVKDNGKTLDENTEKGRANEAALDDIAQSSIRYAAAVLKQTGSQDQATAAIKSGRDALIAALGQLGVTGQAAEDYADKLGLIPGNVTTVAHLDTSGALTDLYKFLGKVSGHVITFNTSTQQVVGRAGGGILPGAPSSRDNMLVHAASGEFITNARATAIPANRAALEYMNAGGVISGYAGGGYVAAPVAPPRIGFPAPPAGPVDLSDRSINRLAGAVVQKTRQRDRMSGGR
jgi:TP901 family phage tail tape measure protein